jgi:hypothetical protein
MLFLTRCFLVYNTKISLIGFLFRDVQYRPTQRAAGNARFVIGRRVRHRLCLDPLRHTRAVKSVLARSHTFVVRMRARFHTDRTLEWNVRLRTPMVRARPLPQFRIVESRHARARHTTTLVVKLIATVFRNSVPVFAQLSQLG